MALAAGTRLGRTRSSRPSAPEGWRGLRARDPRLGRDVAIKVIGGEGPRLRSGSDGSSRKHARSPRSSTPTSWPSTTWALTRVAVPRPRTSGGRDTAGAAFTRSFPRAQGGRGRRPDLRRPGCGARPRCRPPRPEARERVPRPRRRGEASGLRSGQAARSGGGGGQRGGYGDGHRPWTWWGRRGTCRRSSCGARERRRGRTCLRSGGSLRDADGAASVQGATKADTLAAILEKDPPVMALPGGAVPLPLERVVLRCLEKDPDDRFQSARDVAFALEALSTGRSANRPLSSLRRPELDAGYGSCGDAGRDCHRWCRLRGWPQGR